MSFSNYLEEKVLNHILGGTAFTQPTAWYVKLHVGDPGEDGTANAAGNTTRAQVTSWNAASNPAGTATNAAQVQWTNVSTEETYSYASVWDHVSAGNCLGSGPLGSPVAVTVGATFTIAVGDLTVSLS